MVAEVDHPLFFSGSSHFFIYTSIRQNVTLAVGGALLNKPRNEYLSV
jgi:hypothetical protein